MWLLNSQKAQSTTKDKQVDGSAGPAPSAIKSGRGDGTNDVFPILIEEGDVVDMEVGRNPNTCTIQKDDIFVDSERSNASLWSNGLSLRERSTLFAPETCSICYESYKKGDDVAWSKNQNCLHAFHVDCILEWLMENDDCPICRENFLILDTS